MGWGKWACLSQMHLVPWVMEVEADDIVIDGVLCTGSHGAGHTVLSICDVFSTCGHVS